MKGSGGFRGLKWVDYLFKLPIVSMRMHEKALDWANVALKMSPTNGIHNVGFLAQFHIKEN